ncbi:MAG: hypothetical protein SangKO_015300 [Sandaracinaceae bacterium]
MTDELLERAASALAETTHTPTADDEALAAILRDVAARPPRRERRWGWIAAAAAVLLAFAGGPTAWAWTGEWVQALLSPSEPARAEQAPVPRAAPTPPPRASARRPAAEPPPEREVEEPEAPPPPPVPSARVARRSPRPAVAPASPADGAARIERERFERAYRLHFRGDSPEAALGAWDAYLRAHPDGRYALEARYDRALCLVRLDRLAAARVALEDVVQRGYRVSDARALLDAMGAP